MLLVLSPTLIKPFTQPLMTGKNHDRNLGVLSSTSLNIVFCISFINWVWFVFSSVDVVNMVRLWMQLCSCFIC